MAKYEELLINKIFSDKMNLAHMKIPKTMHQTWKDEQIPEEWKYFTETWKKYHPSWKYILWTDEDGSKFVKEYYPEYFDLYSSYPLDIQRADAIRYFILHKMGGVYVDLDIECLQKIDPLLYEKEFVIGEEPPIHAKYCGIKQVICNAFMASVPGHPFMAAVLKEIKTCDSSFNGKANDVLTTTGPLMITKVYNNNNHIIDLLAPKFIYPYKNGHAELRKLYENLLPEDDKRKRLIKNGTYAVHYWSNSWARNLAGKLKNPEPNNFEGYTFFQGKDSPGFDIANFGREIKILVDECNKEKKSVGFNTDGYLKYYLPPNYKWRRMWSAKDNEGIYVKNDELLLMNRLKRYIKRFFIKRYTL
ncbi:MAG: hypothetical protein KKA84_07125 [Bacteroidetes bacterium]|nr:hypothetical protein [Bacteroidota bacterium]